MGGRVCGERERGGGGGRGGGIRRNSLTINETLHMFCKCHMDPHNYIAEPL